MAVDPPPDSKPEKKKQKSKKSQLRVVFDTNALYVNPTSLGSASDLVRQEIVDVISGSKYPDLDILWYLPEVVRHERQYQMQREALKLRSAINRIERLLGHNLALTDQVLLDRVKTQIDEKEKELGLTEIVLDHSLVDWRTLIHAASYRIPPFQTGENEKGFRDALVAESFLQLLAVSPKTPKVCRVVLVTEDQLLSQAIRERIADSPNASVLSNIEELKGLINTIISNVDEAFIAQLTPKAAKLFFVSGDDKETLYYKEKIGEQIRDKFKSQLEQRPEGTTFRDNTKWYISRPNFSRKESTRVFWTSRIEVEMEAGTVTKEEASSGGTPALPLATLTDTRPAKPTAPTQDTKYFTGLTNLSQLWKDVDWTSALLAGSSPKKVVTHRGRDIFEVLWSTEVTMSKELKKAKIEDVKHVELNCQPIL